MTQRQQKYARLLQKEIGEKEKQKSHNKKSAIRIEYLNGIGFLHPLARLKNIIDYVEPINT
jgi:hypothetical protein